MQFNIRLLIAVPVVVGLHASAETYSLRRIKPLSDRSHDQTSANAIDSAGNVVGSSSSSTSQSVTVGVVMWTDGSIISTGTLADCFPYGGSAVAGVSPGGILTGSSSSICGGYARAMRSTVAHPSAFTTHAPLPGGGDCVGTDASDSGAIVGWSNIQDGCVAPLCIFTNARAMKWLPASQVTLSTGTYAVAAANGINASGITVGNGLTMQDYETSVAVRWDTDISAPVHLLAVNGTYGVANKISDGGVVVGTSDDGPHRKATKWIGSNVNGQTLGAMPGHTESEALDVDDLRGVVGLSRPESTSSSVAVLFRDGEVIHLNNRLSAPNGVLLTSANGINTNGWIAANGILEGKSFGFVLVPCFADLNGDGVVEDSDFTVFVFAYNILDCADAIMPAHCPSDLNRDGLVDDADFVVFVGAYNELLCP